MKIKKGDMVKVISGTGRKLGPSRVLRVIPSEEKVVVEGRKLVRRHTKGNQLLGTESGIREFEAPMHVSNVMLWSEKLEKPVRTVARWAGADGALFESKQEALATYATAPSVVPKVRLCRESGEIFDPVTPGSKA
jgi:large subunit ribosomal protein L24